MFQALTTDSRTKNTERKNMTDREINAAMARVLNWTTIDCNDLNAMHEAEKVLTQDQRGQIVDELCEIVLREKNTESGPMTAIISAFFATARQRAEAFLRTLGKWEEAK
jgi:hypothetical protein